MNSPRHLFLTGFRGTGKSTVGLILGRRLDLPTIDLDEVIEQCAGKTIGAIFEQGGEPLFRDLESQALKQAVVRPSAIISLGGGAILRPANRTLIAQSGICFWLIADAETILGRIQGDAATAQRRPALTNLPALEEIVELLRQRHDAYKKAADKQIETAGKGSETVAEEILDAWRSQP